MKKIIIKIVLIVLLVIRIADSIYKYNFKYENFKNKKIEVSILNIYKINENGMTYEIEYNNDKFLLYIKDNVNIYEYGDKLNIIASKYNIETKRNPYEFDYKKYLNSKGYISSIYCSKVISSTKQNRVGKGIYYIRNNISKKLKENMKEDNANILKTILFGNNLELSDDIKEDFSNIGIGHYLGVSGTNIIILLELYENIDKNKKNKLGKVVILIYFCLMCNYNISLVRALIMKILSIGKRHNSFISKYIITLYIILLINPYNIFNISVIFSFLSILGIYIFNSRISSFLKVKLKKKCLYKICDSISLTLSSQILILPYQISCFGKISLICIFSNVIISVIINFIIFCGLSLFLMFFIPFVSGMLICSCDILISFLMFIVKIINRINYFDITFPRFNIIMYIVYYLFIILILFSTNIWVRFWNRRKLIKISIWILEACCIIIFFLNVIYINYLEDYVIFFNVGQGNMALIHKGTKNIIIDMGSTEKNVAYNVISNFLKAKNIYSIDLILITHMHSDHINGIEKLVTEGNFIVKRIAYTIPCEKTEDYYNLQEIIKNKKIAKMSVTENDNIGLNRIKIEILSPPKDQYIIDEDMLNANSTVYLITVGKIKYLFLGDCTQKSEKYIINNYLDKIKDVDVFQVAHHGSNTSSSEEFISKINKCNAIISAKKSVYGHPSITVISLLNKYDFNTYITENIGAIILKKGIITKNM